MIQHPMLCFQVLNYMFEHSTSFLISNEKLIDLADLKTQLLKPFFVAVILLYTVNFVRLARVELIILFISILCDFSTVFCKTHKNKHRIYHII